MSARRIAAGNAAIAVFWALAVLAAAPAFALEDPVEQMKKTVLPNGLTVLTLEDHTTPVVSFQMWVQAGSRDESRYTGIAHLFEHMMFKGSTNVPPEEHARLIGARGGRINAYTSRDVTVYFEDVTSESLPLVIDLEAERVANLDISEKTLTSEREVVLEERSLRTEENPQGLAFEAIAALAWIAHPYRWPVIGWRSDVENVTVEACREFFDAYYSPNNLVIVIVGDFETSATLAHVERAFGGLERHAVPRNPTVEPEQRGERRSKVNFDLRGPVLAAAWHAPPSGHADAEPLDVASQILSDGRSSRLYRSLVYDAQKALFAEGSYWELKDAGLFFAFVGVRPGESVDEVERLFMAEVRRIQRDGVSSEEVEKAKRQLEVGLIEKLRTAHSVANRIGRDFITFGKVRPLQERLDAIERVTAQDVQRVVREYLVDEKRSVVHVVAPPDGADATASTNSTSRVSPEGGA